MSGSGCKNCFSPIDDLRKETRCAICTEPLHKDCAIKDGGTFYCDVCYTVKEENNVIDTNIVVPEVIRRSYIETYKACPYKFYMEVIKGMESPPNIYTQLGIDVHTLLDKASNDRGYTKKQMVADFDAMWYNYSPTLFESEKQKEQMYQRAIDSIDTAYTIIPNLPDPYKTEEAIEFSVGEDLPKISTTSDRVDLINGELEMSDWKTGTVMVGQKLSTDLQAPLYIYGVRQKYEIPVRKFTFYYLQENKTRVFERVTNDDYVCRVNKREYHINLTDAIREVQSLFSQIKKGNFNIPKDTKKMYFTCKICHLRQQEICQGADVESWQQYNQGGR